MEAIDIKIQEAIESIKIHGNRMKNLIKNDPINNKADESWKLILHTTDMLKQNKKETVKVKNETKAGFRIDNSSVVSYWLSQFKP